MSTPIEFATTDLCDAHGDALAVAAPIFSSFGGAARCAGPIATVRCFEDNSKVREALESPGQGRVLIVDGAGSLRCALVGGMLGELGATNGWAGIVVNGCVRDTGGTRPRTALHPRAGGSSAAQRKARRRRA